MDKLYAEIGARMRALRVSPKERDIAVGVVGDLLGRLRKLG